MAASRYLEQIFFMEQSLSADQLFEERSDTLFEFGDEDSFVDVRFQQSRHETRKSKADIESDQQDCHEELSDVEAVPKRLSEPESSEFSSPVDKCSFLSQDPPPYVEAQGLESKRVSNPQELSKIASVSATAAKYPSGDSAKSNTDREKESSGRNRFW